MAAGPEWAKLIRIARKIAGKALAYIPFTARACEILTAELACAALLLA